MVEKLRNGDGSLGFFIVCQENVRSSVVDSHYLWHWWRVFADRSCDLSWLAVPVWRHWLGAVLRWSVFETCSACWCDFLVFYFWQVCVVDDSYCATALSTLEAFWRRCAFYITLHYLVDVDVWCELKHQLSCVKLSLSSGLYSAVHTQCHALVYYWNSWIYIVMQSRLHCSFVTLASLVMIPC